jgi:hypothetical protein
VKIRDNVADLNIKPYPSVQLMSPSNDQIVDLPDDNRKGVMKVANPKDWAVVFYNLENCSGKKITVKFTAEVKRIGADGSLN